MRKFNKKPPYFIDTGADQIVAILGSYIKFNKVKSQFRSKIISGNTNYSQS